MACIPPAGANTPAIESMYVITAYNASASYGATPAYNDWNPNTRCRRSSSKNEATRRPRRPKPPSRSKRLPARQRRTRSRVESNWASMKLGISTRYSSVSQSAKRSNAAAASGPAKPRISSAIAGRP